jgi:anthranilate phosphoribosyltransferase
MIYELKVDVIKEYHINPGDFGLKGASLSSIRGGTVSENAAILRDVLSGERSPRRDVVLMNAAAVVLAGDKVDNLKEGIKLAEDSIDKGMAMQKLEQLIALSQAL